MKKWHGVSRSVIKPFPFFQPRISFVELSSYHKCKQAPAVMSAFSKWQYPIIRYSKISVLVMSSTSIFLTESLASSEILPSSRQHDDMIKIHRHLSPMIPSNKQLFWPTSPATTETRYTRVLWSRSCLVRRPPTPSHTAPYAELRGESRLMPADCGWH